MLELGGSDPFILLSTDDLDATVDAAIDGRFDNTGQACNAAKRFIVADDIYDDFLDKFTEKVLEAADGLAPLSSVAAAERLDEQVDRAVADGATLVSEGERKGAFFPPGVLTGVSPDSPTYSEELFGPSPWSTRSAPRTRRSKWPTTPRSGWAPMSSPPTPNRPSGSPTRSRPGMVFVNAVGAEGVELPFGGVKRSGFGRELGPLRHRRVRQQEAHPHRMNHDHRRPTGQEGPPAAIHIARWSCSTPLDCSTTKSARSPPRCASSLTPS